MLLNICQATTMEKIKTHREIIAMLGGIHKLSGLLGGDKDKDYQRVWQWNARNNIPSANWILITDIAEIVGYPVTTRLLAETAKRNEA